MAWFIDADKLLADIETLKKSAWYEFGKKPEQSIAHNWYLSREEAVDKVRKLCIKAENVVDAEPVRRGRWVAEWISVKDRLPKVGQIVLAFGKRSATTGMFQGVIKRNDLWWWKEHTTKYVSHWMPLPEPPKEDDDEND